MIFPKMTRLSAQPVLICAIFFICTLTALAVPYTPLKGAKGVIREFQIEAIEPGGIRAVPRGGYQTLLISWEHLDLNWLKQYHTKIWEKKEALAALETTAYGDFKFGDAKADVFKLIYEKNGVRLANELFQEQSPSALWVTFDPKSMQEFFRFDFDAKDELNEIQVHQNFNSEEKIETVMRYEWRRLAEMVSGYRARLIESEAFPSQREWDKALQDSDLDVGFSHRTHRWQDELRSFELSLAAKAIGFGQQRSTQRKVKLFGQELNFSETAEANTNWVIFVAKLR